MRARVFRFAVWAVALAIGAPSCLSPTLPLPPPSVDASAEGATGLWEVSGSCSAGGWVYAFNETAEQRNPTEEGAFTVCSTAGFYGLALEGKLCDLVNVWQTEEDAANGSSSTGFVLQPYQNDAPTKPNACPE